MIVQLLPHVPRRVTDRLLKLEVTTVTIGPHYPLAFACKPTVGCSTRRKEREHTPHEALNILVQQSVAPDHPVLSYYG